MADAWYQPPVRRSSQMDTFDQSFPLFADLMTTMVIYMYRYAVLVVVGRPTISYQSTLYPNIIVEPIGTCGVVTSTQINISAISLRYQSFPRIVLLATAPTCPCSSCSSLGTIQTQQQRLHEAKAKTDAIGHINEWVGYGQPIRQPKEAVQARHECRGTMDRCRALRPTDLHHGGQGGKVEEAQVEVDDVADDLLSLVVGQGLDVGHRTAHDEPKEEDPQHLAFVRDGRWDGFDIYVAHVFVVVVLRIMVIVRCSTGTGMSNQQPSRMPSQHP